MQVRAGASQWCAGSVRCVAAVRTWASSRSRLTPSLAGCNCCVTHDDHSQYLRGLLLPAISAIDLPPTLLAPRLPFQEGNKVVINTNGEERRAGLDRRVASTHSFNQFAYRSLETAANVDAAGSGVVASSRISIRCGRRFEGESVKTAARPSRASLAPTVIVRQTDHTVGARLAREEARSGSRDFRAARHDPESPADTARHPAQGWKSPASPTA